MAEVLSADPLLQAAENRREGREREFKSICMIQGSAGFVTHS